MPSVHPLLGRAMPTAGSSTVQEVMKSLITSESLGDAAAFYVADLSVITRRYVEFRSALPRVTPFYAVKCNPDRTVIRTLARLGAGFDCASRNEIKLVADAVPLAQLCKRVVYANPHKAEDHLKYAVAHGVQLMTFDSLDELHKIHRLAPNARILIRIAVEDSLSHIPLSSKFGADLAEVLQLLRTANALALNVVGVAFHVGSGCLSLQPYVAALKLARRVFDDALALGLPAMSVLDIGGGFPGHDGEVPVTFSEIADTIRPLIDKLFHSGVDVIAEPGRFFVSAAYTLATQILSVRQRGSGFDYYICDGVYGSFKDACLLDTSYSVSPLLLSVASWGMDKFYPCNLYGPTQDPFDVVLRNINLPRLSAGDWVFFPNMGAYTLSLATNLAGFSQPLVHYHRDCRT